ncbi:branched-chain amino acid ABC transporter permease [Nocardioides panacis]|uniref:Branched-chain amino acid ABC transporter permease n=1 Tax=Nocardioides panacis TaxID=2849501 RepID=A0A975T3M0_9ACTN|nr:branched-chain amino acid ABC transporter permease [Nocardioides panacis]QWZ10263.1 branched-chain amino acid ABC transporter permease [Nocardioides panacis]
MHARPRSIAALLTALAVAALVMIGSGPVSAAPVPHVGESACTKPAPRNDDTIHIQGCLTDTREKPPKAVPGVKFTVVDDQGKNVGEGTSNDSGVFDIALPGKSIDVLGNTYTVKLDKSSLPEGAALRNPKQLSLKVTPKLSSDVYVTFPIGDATAANAGKATQALQLAVGGLVFSLLLAMAALGLSMIFGTTGLTNFAHGELITFGALVAYGVDALPGTITIAGTNVTIAVSIIVAAIASAGFGWLNDRALWRPLRHRGTGLVAMMVVSIGLSIFLRNVYQYLAGASTHQYSQFSSPRPYHIGPILVTPKDVFIVVFSTIVLVVVVIALQRTRLGKATRAVADNTALAAATGINVDRVISVVWIVGAMLAGMSGVLLGMTQGFDYQLGFKILLLVFAATVLGGLGTAWGAIVGALVIGLFVEVSTLFIPAELKFVGALVVLIVVLLVRPQGLLGKAQRVG